MTRKQWKRPGNRERSTNRNKNRRNSTRKSKVNLELTFINTGCKNINTDEIQQESLR